MFWSYLTLSQKPLSQTSHWMSFKKVKASLCYSNIFDVWFPLEHGPQSRGCTNKRKPMLTLTVANMCNSSQIMVRLSAHLPSPCKDLVLLWLVHLVPVIIATVVFICTYKHICSNAQLPCWVLVAAHYLWLLHSFCFFFSHGPSALEGRAVVYISHLAM